MSAVIIALLVIPLFLGWLTQDPKGTSYASPPSTVSDIRMLYDLTYMKDDKLIHEQTILDEQIKMIGAAKDFIVADIFLYNDYYNTAKFQFPHSTRRLSQSKRRSRPPSDMAPPSGQRKRQKNL